MIVEYVYRGWGDDDGHVWWVLVSSDVPRERAREVAQTWGRITESDEAADGRWSFAVVNDRANV